MSDCITAPYSPAMYAHEIMSRVAFEDSFLPSSYGDQHIRGARFDSSFRALEYFNSPLGLIVLAHHDSDGCEAFYPANLNFQKITGITPWCDAVLPADFTSSPRFVRHRLHRKTHGLFLRAVHGRHVEFGSSEAPGLHQNFHSLEVYDAPTGLIVAANRGSEFFVVCPMSTFTSEKEAA